MEGNPLRGYCRPDSTESGQKRERATDVVPIKDIAVFRLSIADWQGYQLAMGKKAIGNPSQP
jgi:hypothetical protein